MTLFSSRSSILRRLVVAFVLPLLTLSIASGSEKSEGIARLQKDLTYLASDELEGRGLGTDGLEIASKYIAEEFKAAGLDITAVNGSPFQKFTLPNGSKLAEPNRLVFLGSDGARIDAQLETDFEVCSFGGSKSVSGELVFCGYGIDNAGAGYSDFEGLDLKGKIAIVMRRTPRQGVEGSPFFIGHHGIPRDAELRTKVSQVFGRGAVGLIFVNEEYTDRRERESAVAQQAEAGQALLRSAEELLANEDPEKQAELREALQRAIQRVKSLEEIHRQRGDDALMEFGYSGTGKSDDMPIVHVKRAVCDRVLIAGLGKSLSQLEAEIDADFKPRSAAVQGWNVELQTSIELVESEIANVIGVLEGEGPLADETIVIGAHYDHVGYGGMNSLAPGSKEVHNGADDNGSGTVALIELARRFASAKQRPARRIVFIAFTAEELGLIGSARYVREPVFPLENTVAMFNMDMVGRLDEEKLTIFGTGTSTRWKPLVVKEGEALGFRLSLQPEGFGPSDHSSFYGKKIPVLHFFTGTHADYHRPGDDADKINYDGIFRVVELVDSIVKSTDATAERPDYVEIKQRANIGRSGNRPYFGSIPDFASDQPGYTLSGVSPESPAAKAGLAGGDRIVQIGEIKIGNLDDFDLALRRFSAGDEIEVRAIRTGKEEIFKVTLAQPR